AGDNSSVSPNSEALFMTVNKTGTYYIQVAFGYGGGNPTWTYMLSAAVFPAETPADPCWSFSSSDTAAITDGGVTTSTINIPEHLRIADLDVGLNITHTLLADLDLILQAPGGNQVALLTDPITTSLTLMDFVLDDEAAIPSGLIYMPLMADMRLTPERYNRLGWFDGQDAFGDWTLYIYDDTPDNDGVLQGWSLTVCEPPPLPACPAGSRPVVLYASDFESDDGGFSHTAAYGTDNWELGLPVYSPLTGCASGSSCWKTKLDGVYSDNSDQALLSPVIDLGESKLVGPLMVSWAQNYQFDNADYDSAFVDLLTADGTLLTRLWDWQDYAMWLDVGLANNTRIQESAGWGVVTDDISAYAGQPVKLSFRLISGNPYQGITYAGWAVDDVSVTGCLSNDVYVPRVSK
ncbi:MAG: peptidase, partial [Anaerolineae bacterium]